ncbi:MAG: hypothetical protein IJW18_02470 [Lachnospiraceae bacterium]|nr:hypothetical protein [Lachnospiraceae bacterium]
MELSEKPIVNLTGLSNTDLKLKYGAGNLDILSEYDENYIELVRTVFEWANRFHELGIDDDCISVLEFGIDHCQTDIYNHYMLLANLYVESEQQHKIPDLINSASMINSMNRDIIINALNSLQPVEAE